MCKYVARFLPGGHVNTVDTSDINILKWIFVISEIQSMSTKVQNSWTAISKTENHLPKSEICTVGLVEIYTNHLRMTSLK